MRPRDAVAWMLLDAAGCAFLDACAAGSTLAAAAEAALAVQGGADLAGLMSTLLAAGAFSRMSRIDQCTIVYATPQRSCMNDSSIR